MIPSLHIQNFKLFRDLKIAGLRRVNLFAGKNNCGKTALLEALRIMAAGMDIRVAEYILQQRGEDFSDPNRYLSLLYGTNGRSNLQMLFDKTIKINDLKIKLEKRHINQPVFFNIEMLNESHRVSELLQNYNVKSPVTYFDRAVYLPFNQLEYFPLEKLWDNIVLTPKEDLVVGILKNTILPDLIRLDVKGERTLIRLEGTEKPVTIKMLGDGAYRVLLIAIALVSAQNNLLLIDEIESGLHYSVLEKLWDIIFKYAEELNVQVFATTHSSDAIKTFTYVLEKQGNKELGAYYRLQADRKNGDIEAVAYDLEKLETSLETNLEPR